MNIIYMSDTQLLLYVISAYYTAASRLLARNLAPWSITDVSDDVEDKLYALDLLFTEILD